MSSYYYMTNIFVIHNNDTQQQKIPSPINPLQRSSTSKTEGSGSLVSIVHQEIFFIRVQFQGLRKVPLRTRRTVVATTTKNHKSCVIVLKLVGVLVRITHKIHHTERRGTVRICIHGFCAWQRVSGLLFRILRRIVLISPRVQSCVVALCSSLPLPCSRKTSSSPFTIQSGFT